MKDKRRLGRGLRALIPDYSELEDHQVERFGDILVTDISMNPFQPREEFDPVALDELKQSIAEKGVIQPITVRRKDQGYQLISGERRLKAVMELGYEEIPAYILKIDSDDEMLELALIENIQREDLNPIDVSKAYERLISECHLTQEDVAQKVGKDRTTVTNFLRLRKLPPDIQASLRKKQISMGHARSLLGIENDEMQQKIWKRIIKQNLSVRKVEQLVREISENNQMKSAPSVTRKSPQILHIEDSFREILGTQVRVKGKNEGGKIEIEYYSKEDLERIFNIITNKENNF